ncbi:S41 family peptidase [Mucilaginibacter myungsuensis]|uniref:S41 family peptidase n=1 Tax=Mucilaginibacter myungsuensis TaxID=649104 RepID=A0A929KUV7_9SPHI|nr:S41 family peptidase [Mucilaginibacter myungsuensis]MBE9661602.1 S41 family peptidase [Mucilaginibacter myungsuensis]MDN3597747.1 S41 family peptidase [Mucilaginibacter myungsuensis]
MKRAAAIIFRSILLIFFGIVIGVYLSGDDLQGGTLANPFAKGDKLERTIRLVKEKYVDTINMEKYEGDAINNLLQNLDPHSLYLPPQQAQSINEKLEGGFTGIGIEFQLLRDTMVITLVYPQGPADKAGIKTGDRVLTIANRPFSGTKLTFEKINNTLRGEKNTPIDLGIAPADGSTDFKRCIVTRGPVSLSSLDAAYMATDDVGYIKLSKFAATSESDFRSALSRLKIEGLKKLIVDLRGNGGGYLSAATSLADHFLPKGKLIVYTKGVHEPRTDYFATDSGLFEQGNLAVLIDESSASASEILAGCLQDQDRGTIIGRRSFGKGLVQEQFPFGDGSAVNLTVARYYTPSGRSIQKSYKNGVDSYHNEIAERMQKGEFFSAESNLKDTSFRTSATYHTAKGKKVFSGGGIMPDVFVPADTTLNNLTIQRINNRQLFTAYVIDKLQPVIKQYQTDNDFVKRYSVTDEELNKFVTYASASVKNIDQQELAASKPSLKRLLKAYLGRFQWGDNVYYHAINDGDPVMVKAVEVVK